MRVADMTQPMPLISVSSLPTGLAHGTLEDNRWSFIGAIPERAVRIDIETDIGTTYSAPCEQTHWTLALDRGDLPTAVMIDATAVDGTLIAREACILAIDDRYQPTRRLRWRRRRARRGLTTYGPRGR
jgi:hypothetical protein